MAKPECPCRWMCHLAVAITPVLVVTACGGPDDVSDTTTDSIATETSAPTTPTPQHSEGTAPPDPGPIGWIPMGPGDPLIPRQYGGLVSGGDDDCDDLRRGPDADVAGSFWDTARQVCLAVRTGAPWPNATSVARPTTSPGPFAACLDQEVMAVINAALAWHQQHPGLQPDVTYAAEGALSACERSMYGLTAVLVGEQDDGDGSVGDLRIEFLIPSRPDADDDERSATVDGSEVSLRLDGIDDETGTRRGVIILDGASADGHTATVAVRTAELERSAQVELPRRESGPHTSDDTPESSSTTSSEPASSSTSDESTSTTSGASSPNAAEE